MLLNQKRNQLQFVPLNQSSQQRAAAQMRQNQIQGAYISKDQRTETKKETQKSNFQLGGYDQTMPQQSSQAGANLLQNKLTSSQAFEVQKTTQKAGQSNFSIGAGKGHSMVTQNKVAFQPEQLSLGYDTLNERDLNFTTLIDEPYGTIPKPIRAKDVPEDARLVNWKLGHETTKYETTHQDAYNGQVIKNNQGKLKQSNQSQEQEKAERLNRMRKNQFKYGNDVPEYESVTRNQFVNHSMDGVALLRLESKLNGKELRQAHFALGTDQPLFEKANNKQYNEKSPERGIRSFIPKNPTIALKFQSQAPQSKNANQASNFSTAQSKSINPNQFISLSRAAGESVNVSGLQNNVSIARQNLGDLKKDLRTAHFQFGNSEQTYNTHAGSTMIEHQLTGDLAANRGAQKEKMQKANFTLQTIGAQSPRRTTYAQTIGEPVDPASFGEGRGQLVTGLKAQSITTYVKSAEIARLSETHQQYMKPKPSQNSAENKDLKKYMKGSHFEIGANAVREFDTINKLGYPGTATHKAYMVPQEVKNEQRATHFKMGWDASRPQSAVQQNAKDANPYALWNSQQAAKNDSRTHRAQVVQQPAFIPKVQALMGSDSSINRPKAYANSSSQDAAQEVASRVARNRSSNIAFGITHSGIGPKTSNQTNYRWIQPTGR